MAEADLLAQFTTIVTPIILIGGMLFGAVKYLQQQAEKKAARVKEQAEDTASDLKDLTERVALDVKTKVELAKEATTKTAEDLKTVTTQVARETKVYTDAANKEMLSRIDTVDKRVMEMLSDLRRRADLTNGNVSTIRTEIADMADDIQDLYEDRMAHDAGGDGDSSRIEMAKRKRVREKQQRLKRRNIEADRVAQSERSLQMGDSR